MKRILLFIRTGLGALGWGALLVFISSRAGDIVNLACRVYLGRKLEGEAFGAIDPVFSLLAVATIPITAFFQVAVKAISRFNESGNESGKRALLADMSGIAFAGSLLSVALILLFDQVIMVRLHLEGRLFLVIIIFLLVSAWWHPLCMAVFQGERDYRKMLMFSFLASLSMLVMTYLLIDVFPMGLAGALLAKVFPGLVVIVFLLIILWPVIRGDRVRDELEMKLMRGTLVPMIVYLSSMSLLMYSVPLFVRNFIVTESGGYGALATLGMMPSYVIASVVFVIFPLASAEHAGGREVKLFYRQALVTGGLVTAGFTVLFYFLGGVIMSAWNSSFCVYSPLLWGLTLAMGLNGIIQIIASVEMARHRYGVLHFIAWPSIGMALYLYCIRSSLTLQATLRVLLLTHMLILAGIVIFYLKSLRWPASDRAPRQ